MFDVARLHGWAVEPTIRERGVLANDPRDTFVDVVNNDPPAVWEFIVPNGDYRVSLLCGDAVTAATHQVALEGQVVIRDEPTLAGHFFERQEIPVRVSDGCLTLTLGGNGELTRTKLNAILITPGTPAAHVLLAPTGGERMCIGSALDLRWSGATAGAAVRVELSRNGPAGPWEPVWVTDDDGQELIGVAGPVAEELFAAPGEPKWQRARAGNDAVRHR